jgi:hypothetical protein
LTKTIQSAIIVRMIPKRLSMIAVALCICTPLAHAQATAKLKVEVTDQIGTVVPGAHFTATNNATGARVDAAADATGQSVVHLDQGIYDLKVTAPGFKHWMEKNVDAKAETNRRITLLIGDTFGPTIIQQGPEIPLDHEEFAAEIPLITMQQLAAPAKLLRRRSHWF